MIIYLGSLKSQTIESWSWKYQRNESTVKEMLGNYRVSQIHYS